MKTMLFLLCNPSHPCISPVRLADVLAHLAEAGVKLGRHQWLQEGVAVVVPCEGIVSRKTIEDRLKDEPIDIILLPETLYDRKKLLLADMDSTIITTESLDELAAFAGVQDKVAGITARAMNGELDFQEALRERVAMLQGLPESTIDKVLAHITYMPGARTLLATMKANGACCVLVSGGFRQFTGHVRRELGFDEDVSNSFAIENGVLTGEVVPPVHDRHSKLATLERLMQERMLMQSDTMTVGDGANDLPMLQAAGPGVAFRAKPVVAAQAAVSLQYADLTGLLFLQGYSAGDFQHTIV